MIAVYALGIIVAPVFFGFWCRYADDGLQAVFAGLTAVLAPIACAVALWQEVHG